MKSMAMILATVLMPAMAAAQTAESETLQSQSLVAEMTRRPVTMTSDSGKTIRGEQVYLTMRRRDGRPIGADQLDVYVPFAERAACEGRNVLVSLIVGVKDGAGQYEVLCAPGN